jgi:hypothetical protein
MTKTVRQLLKQLPGDWTFTQGRKHARLHHVETGAMVICSSTPSCSRAVKNIVSDCRRVIAKVQQDA